MTMDNSIIKGTLIIAGTTLISSILAMTVDMSSYGLGGFYNMIMPFFDGVILGTTYLLTCLLTKNQKIRKYILILCCVFLVYVGLALHFEKDYWPLV